MNMTSYCLFDTWKGYFHWYLITVACYPDTKGGEKDMKFWKLQFLKDNTAIETSEVAVIMAVVVLVAFGAYQLLGQKIAEVVQNVAGSL